MDEKRKFVRFKVTFPFNSDTQCSFSSIKGLVKDISMSGIRITLDKSLQFLAENLEIFNLQLPGKTLSVTGKLVWKREYGDRKEIGVNFVYMSDTHKEDIYDYIYKHHRQELTQRWWQM